VNARQKPGLGARLRGGVDKLRHYHEISEVGELVRRYVALNAFDGVLTTLGILVGGYLGGVDSARTLLLVGLSTATAMAVSGFYGSYLVEKAERSRALRELEESTLSSLEGTDISAASRYATVVIALADGGSPSIASAIAFIPFVFTGVIGMTTAYAIGVGIAFVECFALGVFLGRVSRERLIVSGLKLVVAGGVLLVISLLLELGVE
jgi:predicted membrane protein (TIGR00267 family)